MASGVGSTLTVGLGSTDRSGVGSTVGAALGSDDAVGSSLAEAEGHVGVGDAVVDPEAADEAASDAGAPDSDGTGAQGSVADLESGAVDDTTISGINVVASGGVPLTSRDDADVRVSVKAAARPATTRTSTVTQTIGRESALPCVTIVTSSVTLGRARALLRICAGRLHGRTPRVAAVALRDEHERVDVGIRVDVVEHGQSVVLGDLAELDGARQVLGGVADRGD